MPPSIGTIVQYAILAAIGYVIAGAPLLSIFTGPSSDHNSAKHRHPIPVEKVESLVIPEKNLSCSSHTYQVHVFGRDPLVLYIEGFLSEEETDHVVRMSEPHFKPSTVWTGGQESLDPSIRKSEKARLDRDEVVKCIEDRARVFQGWRPYTYIEKLWSQRYSVGGHYKHHYDGGLATKYSGRISSFMVYLDATKDIEGGGTNFPLLKRPEDDAWCRFIECDGNEKTLSGDRGEVVEGVTFKPIKGNAVYWENFRSDGTQYKESWHAGLPVKKGVKIGLNIWSWYQEGWAP